MWKPLASRARSTAASRPIAVGPEHPGLARGRGLRHDHRHAGDAPLALGPGVVAVVALREPRAAAGGVGLLLLEVAVRALEAVVGGLRERRVDEVGPVAAAGRTCSTIQSAIGLGSRRLCGWWAGAVLDHHGDPAAQLVVAVLDGQRVPLQEEVQAAADVQQRRRRAWPARRAWRSRPAGSRGCRRRCRRPCRDWPRPSRRR